MPVQSSEFIATLRARLTALDVERQKIIDLLETLGETVERRDAAPVFSVVPNSEKTHLVKDANGRTGLTPVIQSVARANPGLTQSQLARRMFDYVTGDVPPSHDAMVAMVKYATERKYLERRGRLLYATEEAQEK